MRYWVYINNKVLENSFEEGELSSIPGFNANTLVCKENPPAGETQEWLPAKMYIEAFRRPLPPPPQVIARFAEPVSREPKVTIISGNIFGKSSDNNEISISNEKAYKMSDVTKTNINAEEKPKTEEKPYKEFTKSFEDEIFIEPKTEIFSVDEMEEVKEDVSDEEDEDEVLKTAIRTLIRSDEPKKEEVRLQAIDLRNNTNINLSEDKEKYFDGENEESQPEETKKEQTPEEKQPVQQEAENKEVAPQESKEEEKQNLPEEEKQTAPEEDELISDEEIFLDDDFEEESVEEEEKAVSIQETASEEVKTILDEFAKEKEEERMEEEKADQDLEAAFADTEEEPKEEIKIEEEPKDEIKIEEAPSISLDEPAQITPLKEEPKEEVKKEEAPADSFDTPAQITPLKEEPKEEVKAEKAPADSFDTPAQITPLAEEPKVEEPEEDEIESLDDLAQITPLEEEPKEEDLPREATHSIRSLDELPVESETPQTLDELTGNMPSMDNGTGEGQNAAEDPSQEPEKQMEGDNFLNTFSSDIETVFLDQPTAFISDYIPPEETGRISEAELEATAQQQEGKTPAEILDVRSDKGQQQVSLKNVRRIKPAAIKTVPMVDTQISPFSQEQLRNIEHAEEAMVKAEQRSALANIAKTLLLLVIFLVMFFGLIALLAHLGIVPKGFSPAHAIFAHEQEEEQATEAPKETVSLEEMALTDLRDAEELRINKIIEDAKQYKLEEGITLEEKIKLLHPEIYDQLKWSASQMPTDQSYYSITVTSPTNPEGYTQVNYRFSYNTVKYTVEATNSESNNIMVKPYEAKEPEKVAD